MKRLFSALALWLFYAPLAHAADFGQGNLGTVGTAAGLSTGTSSLPLIIGNIIRILEGALGLVFLLLTIYAGYLYLTARGDEEHVKHAKGMMTQGVIGLVIILAAYAITGFVLNAITAATSVSK